MSEILSFDCANKTLAFVYAQIDLNIHMKLDDATLRLLHNVKSNVGNEKFIDIISGGKIELSLKLVTDFLDDMSVIMNILDNFVKVKKSGVIDVLSGLNISDTTNVFRIQCLHDTLNGLNIQTGFNTIILIEEQPDVRNVKSNEVEAALMMFYTIRGSRIVTIDPTYKNKINLTPDIHRNVFLTNCNSLYQANKMHSSANFMYLLKLFKLDYMLDTLNGSKYDDLADSFMQIIAWMAVERKKNI